MIHYLTAEQKPESRSLWEEAFSEDSKAFADYYYREKVTENRILALEEDGRIDAMIQMNPYRVRVRDQIWNVDYLVGVATRADRRRRGYMRKLFDRMFLDMWEEQKPFCFLMPADEAIYRPLDFVYIFDQPKWEWSPRRELAREPLLPWKDSIAKNRYLDELADWFNGWLSERYQVFAVRDRAYLRRLFDEIASEAGTFDVLYDRERLVGVESVWGMEEPESRILLGEAGYVREVLKKPAIMARIVCLDAMARAIRLTKEAAGQGAEQILLIRVSDPLIPGNDGLFYWHLNRETSFLKRADEAAGDPDLALCIGELTGWWFGYQTPEAAKAFDGIVETLQGVYLDEVV